MVKVVHWNPRLNHRRGGLYRRIPFGPRVNNFGDLLGPIVVQRLLADAGVQSNKLGEKHRLLTIGSIMSLARSGDSVWGTGVNGKSVGEPLKAKNLDIRAVRGPLTREIMNGQGYEVPEVYGDPGLLMGILWSREELRQGMPRRRYSIVNNLNDWNIDPIQSEESINPRSPVWECIAKIASSDFVVGSSLHGIVVAEALGIPAKLIASRAEPPFKYSDYYMGSGRNSYTPASSEAEALLMNGEELPNWDPEPLLAAFPIDLWK